MDLILSRFPQSLQACFISSEEALHKTVVSNTRIGSGFASSEPHTFMASLWNHIVTEDLTDISVTQGLFMAAHPLCVGEALSKGGPWSKRAESLRFLLGPLGVADKAKKTARQLDGLKKLSNHYDEMLRRRILLRPAFMGAATNRIIPDTRILRQMFPRLAGRNTSRLGITDMQSIHFPDAVDSMGYLNGVQPKLDVFVAVMTLPDEAGFMSHGPANGANEDVIDIILRQRDMNLLIYVNPGYPFTRGYGDRPSTIHLSQFEDLARDGKLFFVLDDAPVPAAPTGAFQRPSSTETAIASNVVNHIEMHADQTYGRALQVGIGKTGVQAIRLLRDTGWWGRQYSEMLEPFTLDLFESGRIRGTHWIEGDGRRTMLDGKIICTFSMAEEGDSFYQRLHNHPDLIMAPASRVVIPEGFYYGMGINNCLGIDFHGHINSAGRESNHHSGIGGGAMIVRGLARGGIGYMCLKSTYRDFQGKLRSAISPFLPPGCPISHVGPDMTGGREGARLYIVTEHGIFQTSGCSQHELIRGLIQIADPRFQEDLKKSAWESFRVRI